MEESRNECSCGESFVDLSEEIYRAGGHLTFFRDDLK